MLVAEHSGQYSSRIYFADRSVESALNGTIGIDKTRQPWQAEMIRAGPVWAAGWVLRAGPCAMREGRSESSRRTDSPDVEFFEENRDRFETNSFERDLKSKIEFCVLTVYQIVFVLRTKARFPFGWFA